MEILECLAEYALSVILNDEETERYWSAFQKHEAITIPELGEGEFYVEEMSTSQPLTHPVFLLRLREKWTPRKAYARSKALAEKETKATLLRTTQ